MSTAAQGKSDPAASHRSARADRFLIEHLVQEAFQGTEYPLGYPAVERELASASARVRTLGAARRKDLLEIALGREQEERIGPRFSSQLWEGAALSSRPMAEPATPF